MTADQILDQYHAAMQDYYDAIDNDQPHADDLLALANAIMVDYDRALLAEFDTSVGTAPVDFFRTHA